MGDLECVERGSSRNGDVAGNGDKGEKENASDGVLIANGVLDETKERKLTFVLREETFGK